MRREHKSKQSFVDWLNSVGCLIYLPLSQGDLQDKITGNYLTLSGDGSLTWDNSQQMYLCTTPSSNGYVASIPFPYNYSDFSEDQFTKYWTYRRASTSGNFCSTSYLSGGATPVVLMGGGGTLNIANYGSARMMWMMTEGSPRKVYNDWTLVSSSVVYSPNLPSAWANAASTIYFGVAYDYNTRSKQVYMRDILYFNHGLTDAEIATLSTYIQ